MKRILYPLLKETYLEYPLNFNAVEGNLKFCHSREGGNPVMARQLLVQLFLCLKMNAEGREDTLGWRGNDGLG